MSNKRANKKEIASAKISKEEAQRLIKKIGNGLSKINRRAIFDFSSRDGHIALGYKSITCCFKNFFDDAHFTTLNNHLKVAKVENEYGGKSYIGKNSIHAMLPLTRVDINKAVLILNELDSTEQEICKRNVQNLINELSTVKEKTAITKISSEKSETIIRGVNKLLNDDKREIIDLFVKEYLEDFSYVVGAIQYLTSGLKIEYSDLLYDQEEMLKMREDQF